MKQTIFSRLSLSSKGQAALEFLTTYGWMFMIVIIVFAALSYFGLTDLRQNIPEDCRFEEAFECNAYVAYNDGSYAFEITNIDGRRINIINVVCGFSFTDEQVRYNFSTATVFNPGDSRTYECDSGDVSNAPTDYVGKFLQEMRIVYTYVEQDPFPKVSTGEMTATVTDDNVLYLDYRAAAEPIIGVPFAFTP